MSASVPNVMRVLLWTDGDRQRSAAARQWFHDMWPLLRARGIDAHVNDLTNPPYDVALVHWRRLDRIQQIQRHSPQAHIGVLNPGFAGSSREILTRQQRRQGFADSDEIVEVVDFFVVTGFMWRELLLPLGRRIYQVFDYVTDLDRKPLKSHEKTDGVVIGYHGNAVHFAQDFFPHGARAIERLSKMYDIRLKVVTSDAVSQPAIPGVTMERVEWRAETFNEHAASFDIGICPTISSLGDLVDPYHYVRNPNRALTLLAWGIPSVTSPGLQNCNDLHEGETTLFATTEHGWYDALERLIKDPDLRNRIGRAGRRLVEEKFSEQAAVTRFQQMFEQEREYARVPRSVLK